LQDYGITNVSTVHQAKGLEYDNVIVVDHDISSVEDLNIAYVALTRAKDSVFVINFAQLESYLKKR
jgi:ATP-dependent exoDNAse (exonuclease V) beta subunit